MIGHIMRLTLLFAIVGYLGWNTLDAAGALGRGHVGSGAMVGLALIAATAISSLRWALGGPRGGWLKHWLLSPPWGWGETPRPRER